MIPLEIVGHREVRLKLLITAVEVLFQGGTEDKRDSWEAFSNADMSRIQCAGRAVSRLPRSCWRLTGILLWPAAVAHAVLTILFVRAWCNE